MAGRTRRRAYNSSAYRLDRKPNRNSAVKRHNRRKYPTIIGNKNIRVRHSKNNNHLKGKIFGNMTGAVDAKNQLISSTGETLVMDPLFVPTMCSQCPGGPPQCDSQGNYWNKLHGEYRRCPDGMVPFMGVTDPNGNTTCACSGPTRVVW
jgi:hypothetical protein